MTKEEELQKYMDSIERCKEQLNSLDIQFSYIQNVIADQTKAKLALEQLKKTDDNVDLLFPVGGGAFIDATAKKTSKILFDVGDGVVIEKSSNEVIKKIDKRMEDLRKTEEKISSMAQQLQLEAAQSTEKAQKIISEVFESVSSPWRGIGRILDGGLMIKDQYEKYDADKKFDIKIEKSTDIHPGCSCHLIMTGKLSPNECKLFRKSCTPLNPVGPCMVSMEGTCSIYYKYYSE